MQRVTLDVSLDADSTQPPLMGEDCELEVRFEIGARAMCRDGRCGKVAKLVVDPATEQVTDLIVQKGFLQKEDRVVPVSAVARTSRGEVRLDVGLDELRTYRRYREVEFTVPARGWNRAEYRPEDIRHSISPYEGIGGQSVAPSRRQHFHEGIGFGSAVIGEGTRVSCRNGGVGFVDHVLVDCEQGHITHLIVRRALQTAYHIVPVDAIETVDDEGVHLVLTLEEVTSLPRYHA